MTVRNYGITNPTTRWKGHVVVQVTSVAGGKVIDLCRTTTSA